MIFSSDTNPELPGNSAEPIFFPANRFNQCAPAVMTVGKAAVVAITGNRLNKHRRRMLHLCNLLLDSLPALLIKIGVGFRLGFAIQNGAQHFHALQGVLFRMALIIEEQYRNMQIFQGSQHTGLRQCGFSAQLRNHQIGLLRQHALQIDLPQIVKAHIDNRCRLRSALLQQVPGLRILLFRQVVSGDDSLKGVLPIQ